MNLSKIVMFITAGILLASFTYAVDDVTAFWACFDYGERINFCNPGTPDRTCASSGGCMFCMSAYYEAQGCYDQGNWRVCNGLQGQECFTGGGSSSIDSQPPVITLSSPSPMNDSLFTSTGINFRLGLDEYASVYYIDEDNNRGRWSRVCTKCKSIDKTMRFKEGPNKIKIKARDVVGNEAFKTVEFFIDSKRPRLLGTSPSRGFVSGSFSAEFTELNPQRLILYYGNSLTGFRQHSVDLGQCYEPRRGRTACDSQIDISDYDGQVLDYWYELEDIAGNIAESRPRDLEVDMTPPVISRLSYEQDGNRVTFDIAVTDLNFELLSYIDNSDTRPRERRLCSRLRDGACQVRKSFRDGPHNLTIIAYDEAGNKAQGGIIFQVGEDLGGSGEDSSQSADTRRPRILKTDPTRGFTSGDFYVEFIEENPKALEMTYGNSLAGFMQHNVDLGQCYEPRRGRTACDVSVDVSSFEGQEIEYWFGLEDIAGNTDASRARELKVDQTPPVIHWLNFEQDRRRITFNISASDQNFDSIAYIDISDTRQRERRLCTRLRDDVCERRKSFRTGPHDLKIIVYDEAGNKAEGSIYFEIE